MKTMQEQLIEKGLSAPVKDGDKKEARPKEKLSDREWAEIMGSNRDVFRRVKGGAIRRR